MVVEEDGAVIAFAAAQPSSTRREAGLRDGLREMKWNKLVSHVFARNTPSRKMLAAVGFREVGTLMRHGELDGENLDVVLVELLL